MSEQITITHERTDDIPVIIAFLLKMRVAELIDQHFPTNGNWTGLRDRKSTRLNSSHLVISYAVFCLKKKAPVEHHLPRGLVRRMHRRLRCCRLAPSSLDRTFVSAAVVLTTRPPTLLRRALPLSPPLY